MSIITRHNLLRSFRNASPLTQEDIAYLLGVSCKTTVSKWERGTRMLPLASALAYIIVFETDFTAIFPQYRQDTSQLILERIPQVLASIDQSKDGAEHQARRKYLHDLQVRLLHDYNHPKI